ncbi:hypothetical protein BST95_19375 (plasmid) [Halioglobus japonicus]|uniref:CDP-glycerol glycerophosphotransferase family protein n=1 Tax=Halioglobus japonicus TaxID=930805 RepID=UPI0009796635|nr:CDP-glycerol glycerophosphotransferase family protein [Halioglobus japonicus]AQA20407.1 hypothetical protein BST95_19375 [Halioglobus japonicus]
MKIDKTRPDHWLMLALQGGFSLLIVALRWLTPRSKRPVVALYGHQYGGNLKAIYEYLASHCSDQVDPRVLLLDRQQAHRLRADGIRTLSCTNLFDMLQLVRCRVLVSDHGLHAMLPLVHLTDIRFVDVWHGIPFKGFVPDDFKLQHHYDESWVTSPLLEDLYVQRFGFRQQQVHSLGYARTDQLFSAEARPADKQTTVLYAPTWRQDDAGRELFPFGLEGAAFIRAIAATCDAYGARLIIRSHLNAEIQETGLSNVEFRPQKAYPDTEALLADTDILLCDWSSIAFDFLCLQRPMLFIDVPPPFKNGFSLGPNTVRELSHRQ